MILKSTGNIQQKTSWTSRISEGSLMTSHVYMQTAEARFGRCHKLNCVHQRGKKRKIRKGRKEGRG
jgi:hypothetical protein